MELPVYQIRQENRRHQKLNKGRALNHIRKSPEIFPGLGFKVIGLTYSLRCSSFFGQSTLYYRIRTTKLVNQNGTTLETVDRVQMIFFFMAAAERWLSEV